MIFKILIAIVVVAMTVTIINRPPVTSETYSTYLMMIMFYITNTSIFIVGDVLKNG